MRHRPFSTLGFIVLASLALSTSSARAQTTAVGPYYATPAWDQTLPSGTRFIVLSNMNNEAVLDRETGLVWQRTPGGVSLFQAAAFQACWHATTGGRQGWRVPTVAELMSLADATNNRPFEIRLPPGHPFFANGLRYWASDRLDRATHDGVSFYDNVEVAIYFGNVVDPNGRGDAGGRIITFFPPAINGSASEVWCVRGGQGGSAR